MDPWMAALRLIHIFAGIFWVGVTFFTEAFLAPVINMSGPEGGRFMARLVTQTRFAAAIAAAAMATQISGIILYVIDYGRFGGAAWVGTHTGLSFTVGGLAGLLTLIPMFAWFRPTNDRLLALGQEMQAAGGPPSPAQQEEMRRLQERRNMSGRTIALLLVIAVIFMSIAQAF